MHNLIYLDRHIGQMLYICIIFLLYAFETRSCHAYNLKTNISIKHIRLVLQELHAHV